MLKPTHDLSTGLGRLARLADDLLTVPKENFNLDGWELKLGYCGFAGCAVGWLATFDWAKDRGFALEPYDQYLPVRVPTYNGLRSYEAAEAFLELSNPEARDLFCPMRTNSHPRHYDPVAQAAHIQKFLKEKGYYD